MWIYKVCSRLPMRTYRVLLFNCWTRLILDSITQTLTDNTCKSYLNAHPSQIISLRYNRSTVTRLVYAIILRPGQQDDFRTIYWSPTSYNWGKWAGVTLSAIRNPLVEFIVAANRLLRPCYEILHCVGRKAEIFCPKIKQPECRNLLGSRTFPLKVVLCTCVEQLLWNIYHTKLKAQLTQRNCRNWS